MDPVKQVSALDPSKQCAVTNNSSASVVVLTPSTAEVPGNTDSGSISVYDQNIEVLPLAEGGMVIAPGKTGTVTLDQQYTDPKTGHLTYSLVYDLLVSTSNWYYPVANLGVMQNIFATPANFPAQTAADQKSMQDADVFYQTIAAYPTSKLAKDYQAAMSGALHSGAGAADGTPNSSANVASAIGNGANTFFKSTKGFQDVTLANLMAVQSYYDKFPFGWAQYKSITYYLYGSVNNTTNFIGTLSLTQPAALDLTLPNAGYTCTFTPASDPTDTTKFEVDASQAKSLTYTGALFVDDINADIPAVALRGTYQLKRLFTQKTTDTQAIVVITGTVDGVVSIGFDSPQSSKDPSSSSFWTTLFHPKGAAQIFSSIMQIGGAIMMLHFFATTAYGLLKKAFGAKEPTTADMFKTQREALEKTINEKVDAAVKKLSEGKESAPADPDAAMNQLAEERGAVADNVSAGNLQEGLEAEAGTLQELAKYESEMSSSQLQSLEQSASDIQNSNSALDNATPDTLNSVVTSEQKSLTNIQTNVGDLTTDMESSLSADAQTQISENAQASQTASDDVDQAKEDAENDETNSDPEVEDPTIPEV
jgi:hypothetical protein